MRILIFVVLFISMDSLSFAMTAQDIRLYKAIERLEVAAVKKSLDDGADPNAHEQGEVKYLSTVYSALTAMQLTPEGWPVNQAITNPKKYEIIKLLFDHGAKIFPESNIRLIYAIHDGNLPLVRLLVERGMSPKNKEGDYLPTHLALRYNQQAVYDLLIEMGATPVDASDSAQSRAVKAASYCDVKEFQEAVESGASVNRKDASGKTALIGLLDSPLWLRRECSDLAMWLVDNGANLDESGLSPYEMPLHLFIISNAKEMPNKGGLVGAQARVEKVFRYMLSNGAKVSGVDYRGLTPLHVAAKENSLWSAKILIQVGAKVKSKDKTGKTPLDYAESADMIALLKKNGATE